MNTSHDFPFACKPDITVYDHGNSPRGFNSSLAEFVIEFKTALNQDPFRHELDSSANADPTINPFMETDPKGCETAGQIIVYATLLLGAQYRTHAFSVLIIKDYARLIRWDRSGAIVTGPIYYETASHLSEFFIRYDLADREARGHDTTVGPPSSEEEQAARTIPELNHSEPLLSVNIQDSRSQESRRFIISRTTSVQNNIPVGRRTRISIAYDVKTAKRVLIKDSWRVLLEGIEPEGEIYAVLHREKVPNIAHCSLAGDVGDETYHRTRTDQFAGKYGFVSQIVPHRHYRLVLDTIGEDIKKFKYTKQMFRAVYAALRGALTRS
jgi:hypothetical protein